MGRRQCEEAGCSKGGIGGTGYCVAHGGGKRCQHACCLKSAADGGTPLQGTWRRQAVPRGGLP
jgi:hypothetical protein